MTHIEFIEKCQKAAANEVSNVEILIDGCAAPMVKEVQYEGKGCPNLSSLLIIDTMVSPRGIVVAHLSGDESQLSIMSASKVDDGDLVLRNVYVQSCSSIVIFEFITQV